MSQLLTAAVDTSALLSEPDAAHNTLSTLQVEKDAAVAFVLHPITGKPVGATLVSAILRLYTAGPWGLTPTVTAQAADAFWGASGLTWNNRPGVTGPVATVSHASSVDADEFAL